MKGPLVDDNEVTVAIRRCQAGDIEGLATLIGHFQGPAQQLAMLLIGDRDQVEDLVQDSFIQAYRAIGKFRPEAPFAPWLYRIVINLARNRQRSSRTHREVSLNLMMEQGHDAELQVVATQQSLPDPAATVEQDEVRQAMLDALAELSQLLREAIVLRYYFGYSDTEIAKIVRCQPAAVRKRIQRGMDKLEHVIQARYAWLLLSNDGSFPLSSLKKEGRPHGAA